MIFHRLISDYFGGDDGILEQEPMQRFTAEKQLMAYRHEDFLFAMDTYPEYKYLNELWKVWE